MSELGHQRPSQHPSASASPRERTFKTRRREGVSRTGCRLLLPVHLTAPRPWLSGSPAELTTAHRAAQCSTPTAAHINTWGNLLGCLLPLDFLGNSARSLTDFFVLLTNLPFLELRQPELQRWPMGRPGIAVGGSPVWEFQIAS